MKRIIIVLFLGSFIFLPKVTLAVNPVLNFSDITSGPKTGNTDGVGSGSIVTVWGNYLGSSQGASKIYVGNSEVTAVYYWKNADGQLPGGPADLYTYHKMQEVAFAVPANAPDGATTIKVVVDGVETNTLPFTVRSGRIKFVKSTGNDTTGDGSWSNPWKTLQTTLTGGNGKLTAGDIVYSVGAGSSNALWIGQWGGYVGTASSPFALIAYPNTLVSLISPSGLDTALRNYANNNRYWHFSKFNIITTYQAFSMVQGGRVVGNHIEGPNIADGAMSGFIGGNCTGQPDASQCSDQKILGNEVTNYGRPDGTTPIPHHLMYMSNRSYYLAGAYEVGWNNFHDNPLYQGIHIYDQAPQCGGWTGTFKIHDNVVKNQGANAINLNVNCPETLSFEVYNNLVITDKNYTSSGQGIPAAPFRIGLSAASTVKIFNNTVYGYGSSAGISGGQVDFRNNIMFDNRNLAYFDSQGTPVSNSNNIFYSSSGRSLPSWAGTGSLLSDPIFMSAGNFDFSLQSNSPAIGAGSDDILSIAPRDFFGQIRGMGNVSMGAMEFITGSSPAPTCSDGIQNGTETGVDCGGSCSVCAVPKTYKSSDFITLVSDWLKTIVSSVDLNGDGNVNAKDLGMMMGSWE